MWRLARLNAYRELFDFTPWAYWIHLTRACAVIAYPKTNRERDTQGRMETSRPVAVSSRQSQSLIAQDRLCETYSPYLTPTVLAWQKCASGSPSRHMNHLATWQPCPSPSPAMAW